MLDLIDFPFVFLDEASMASEPLSLVPLTKGSAQVAIIGDHKQLPPVIVSEDAQMGGLALSLFERLIHEHREYQVGISDNRRSVHHAGHTVPHAPGYFGFLQQDVLQFGTQGRHSSI